MRIRFLQSAAAAAIVVLGLGCSSTQTAGERIDDASITANVKAHLAGDPDVKSFGIDVDTRDGVVTLSGRVASTAERARAEDLARRTDGVKAVRNQLAVGVG